MANLRFPNPSDLACYGDYDFHVESSIITVRAADLRDIYAQYLDNHRKFHARISEKTGRFKEAVKVTELHGLLSSACDEGRDLDLQTSEYIWSFVSGLMFDRRFVNIFCPPCGREFDPQDCHTAGWAYGSGLAAHGGKRVLCPCGHTLYSCMQWNS
jgi:hypothetical protein